MNILKAIQKKRFEPNQYRLAFEKSLKVLVSSILIDNLKYLMKEVSDVFYTIYTQALF